MMNVAALPSTLDLDDQDAKQWDLLLLNSQISLLDSDALRFDKYKATIQTFSSNIVNQLSKMPDVKKMLPFIESLTDDAYWEA